MQLLKAGNTTMSNFMRPMEHSPAKAMHLLKSQQQNMMEQLGLNDDDLKQETSSSDSDSEGQLLPNSTGSPIHSTSSSVNEMRELKHMLRVTQHKLHLAQSNLTECEHNRERKMKIMRKTHQSALALKQALIQELQDIIAEKDEIINTKLRNSQADDVNTKPCLSESQDCLQRLVEQLIHLQKEYTAILESYGNLSEELQLSISEKERLQQKLELLKDCTLKSPLPSRSANSHLVQQIRDMRQKVTQLEKANRSHIDNEELQVQVEELKSQLNTEKEKNDQEKENVARLKSQLCAVKTEQKRLQEEWKKVNESKAMLELTNGALKAELEKRDSEISTLQTSLKDKVNSISDLELKLRMEEELSASSRKQCNEVKENLLHSKEKVRDLLRAIHDLEKSNERRDAENQELRQQLQHLQSKQAPEIELANKTREIKHSLSKVSEGVCCTQKLFTGVRDSMVECVKTLQWDLSTTAQEIHRRISVISEQNCKLLTKYRREMALRKKLHNQLVDLKGNIRVFCRIRPPIAEDGTGPSAAIVVKPDSEDDGALSVLSHGSWRRFEMDKVFGPSSTQEQVFSEVKEVVTSSTDGYNVCIFAYGQTGSGKTFTMEGVPDNPGINQRALLELFNIIDQRQLDWDYTVVVSVLEVYNESIRDLLAANHTEKMDVKQGPDGVYVPGLTQVSVTCLEEVNEVFALGHENRSTGATKMNIYSSRSHALLCITVIGVSKSTGSQTIGRLNLIDLAGSERVAKSGSEGDRLQEAKHINRSLSALGDVIHSLKNKSQHTPYRNSKLTYLLQDSLGGNSKTLMVVQVAPVEKNLGETVCSLNFAQRVKAVELGQASRKILV